MDRLVVPVLSPGAAVAIADVRAQVAAEVIGVVVDIGGMAGLDRLRLAMLDRGAHRCHVVDARAEVAEGACWPALASGALGVAGPPLEFALALPAVARAVIDVASHEGATAVVPWADQPADRQRLRALLRGLAPALGLVSVAGPAGAASAGNVWARVAVLDDLAAVAAAVGSPPGAAAQLHLGFVHGVPRTLNGIPMAAVELLDSLGAILHDCGVRPAVVRAPSGPGGWLVNAPAARVLHEALRSVTVRVHDAATAEVAETVAAAYAAVVRDGTWFAPLRRALDGFVERALESVHAEVVVHVTGGHIEVQA